MLFSDPKWGSGCLAIIGVTAGLYAWGALDRYFGWNWSLPTPVGQIVGFLFLLAITRFILNQIFD